MQKLITEIPLYWGIIWLGFSLLLSLWYYKKKDWLAELSKLLVFIMFSLRFLALSCIGLLLLGILYNAKEERIENPLLINVIDPSTSMLNFKDSARVASRITEYHKKLEEKFGQKYEIIDFHGSQAYDFSNEALKFDESSSNLSNYLEEVRERYYQKNIGAIVLFSDGNFNEGSNPIYSAEKFKLTPVFTVGVGDTIVKTDQLIRDVMSNDIAFLNNTFPVKVNVEALKLKGKKVQLKLSRNGKLLSTKSIEYSKDGVNSVKVEFLLEADTVGYQSYDLDLEVLDEEYNTKNNHYTFYVEVVDGRNKVLLCSSSPHPDLGAIKNALRDNDNLEVKSHLFGNEDLDYSTFDLIVLHDPGNTEKPEELEKIKLSEKPIFYILGSHTDNRTLNDLALGLDGKVFQDLDDIQGSVNTNFRSFIIADELSKAIKSFPPLSANYSRLNYSNTLDIAVFQKVGDITTDKPLLYFGENNNVKYGVVYGEGLWKWRIADYALNQKHDNFNSLVDKITQFLVLKKDASNLRVKLSKRNTSLEDVKVDAEFYNESLELINSADIQFTLINEDKENLFDFSKTESAYLLNLGKLKSGKYKWIASTDFNGKTFLKRGELVVEDVMKEDLETTANHEVLKRIATITKAKFIEITNSGELLTALENRSDIAPVKYYNNRYKDLIDFIWIFVLIVALLGLEWFLRRYNGAY